MTKFAVIETGGKQYKVSAGEKLKIETKPGEAGAIIEFDRVLLEADGDNVKIGLPYVEGAKVSGKVLKQARTKKKIVFKYASKTRRRVKKTHRQNYTEVEITKV